MRKVYQVASGSIGLSLSAAVSLALTAAIFGFIPFASSVAKPSRSLELRKASVADLPPPAEAEPPPTAPEEAPPPEAIAPPQLSDTPQPISLSTDLEVAAGAGGALAGFGEVRAPVVVEKVQQEAFDVAELEKRPEVISQVPPTYPPELRKARIDGLVTVAFVLNEEGRVEDARVESASRPEFEKPALEAIRKWRFRPGMREGRAVRTYIRIPLRFQVGSA
jgi:protein TonB